MKKVLVVEDNEANLYLIRFILEKTGYKVIEARKGAIGVELTVKENPDLVLMDIQLPDIDGLEATKRIRASEADGEIPIIAVTSFAMAGDKEKALAAGCMLRLRMPDSASLIIS